MTRARALLVLGALLAAVPLAGCLGPGPGEPAPPFELGTLDGGTFNLTDHRGQVVVLDFMATWCEPCEAQMPAFHAVRDEHPDVAVLSISVDPSNTTAEDLRDWKEDHDADWPHAQDTAGVQVDYGVRTLPRVFVVDPDGRIAFASPETDAIGRAELLAQVDAAR